MELEELEKRIKVFIIVLVILNIVQTFIIGYLIVENTSNKEENSEKLPYIYDYKIISNYTAKLQDGRYVTILNLSITISNPSYKIFGPDAYSIYVISGSRDAWGYIYLQEVPSSKYLMGGYTEFDINGVSEEHDYGMSNYIVLFLNDVEIDRVRLKHNE